MLHHSGSLLLCSTRICLKSCVEPLERDEELEMQGDTGVTLTQPHVQTPNRRKQAVENSKDDPDHCLLKVGDGIVHR